MKTIKSKNVVFITGAFVHHSCWDEWREYFGKKGFKTSAPPWPFKDAPTAKALRDKRTDNQGLAMLTLTQLVNHYVSIAESYPEKPVAVGHSLGGLITQILVNRELVAAGVANTLRSPKGIIPYELSFYKGAAQSLGLFTSVSKPYMMSFKKWQYAFVNGMPLEEQKAAYNKFTIPESKTVNRGGLGSAAKVDYKKSHPPLLLTSGDNDTIIPAHLNLRNYKRYRRNGSVLDYKEFAGRNHFVLGQHTWKEDADFILSWIKLY